ncbi:primosomal protein DnaI [Halalkalibacterium halodurans]|jgi:primosomal protein DnaI|uniref:Primosome component (Helicase loader) n=2 Tax=Halalkalibacterium halodurans TaxID=86665 RepID=Q9K863_HALH5|nr:primosomal protein DnaI [Halalkalibacterium halodurans]MDY7223677.1 primosomal protein DnaI [Halalkalibacterium halodurans]MDY7242898.1 primosomal protein DnaI [Halalkalibacterium halodurans]MED3645655.1 primosomal protein DnaI [Halalkalibacterium halodurans]MED4082126.1 primosomal protein DnaI [Halalkalibacterium halodurans]MED4084296.1 primosomal protein DnaI [Halalkalibacterium halodurans]
MESIQSSLKHMTGNRSFEKQFTQLKEAVFRSPHVQLFLEEHPSLSPITLEQGLSKLYEYQKEQSHCAHCPGLQKCPNLMKGYQPTLYVERDSLELSYSPCPLKEEEEREKKKRSLIRSLYIPKEILEAKFDDVESEPGRSIASHRALEFALSAKPGEDGMGLYLYGKFGVGKTFLMGAIANELKDRGIDSTIVYVPDFFRELKQSIGDGTFQQKLDFVKNAQVLIFDDIGAETMTSWVRDDVLGVILQYRIMEKLPTLFTSNYDYDELEEHLAYNDKSGTELLKAKRVMERIRHYTVSVMVQGQNRREHQS